MLVSACLLGVDCKYNGKNNLDNHIVNMAKKGLVIPVCPEQLGGLTTPRPKAEILKGNGGCVIDGKAKVIRKNGEDVTKHFISGANQVLKIAQIMSIKKAVLKSKSPSCGVCEIYDGSFCGKLINGNGVTAELLKRNGISVFDENSFKKAIEVNQEG
ncbi:UNVERIFIED_CONTAM: uncharacterized protein YbbK (DUF523 family) [Acetivibrio alkalicellulosi]